MVATPYIYNRDKLTTSADYQGMSLGKRLEIPKIIKKCVELFQHTKYPDLTVQKVVVQYRVENGVDSNNRNARRQAEQL